MSLRVAATLLAFVACAAHAGTAHAFKFSSTTMMCTGGPKTRSLAHRWSTRPVVYLVWSGSAGPDLAAGGAETATQNAFKSFEDLADSDFLAMYGGSVTGATFGNGKNEIFWIQDDWYGNTGTSDKMDGTVTLGLTFTSSDRLSGSSADGGTCPPTDRCDPCPATESDIFLNSDADTTALSWATVTTANSLAQIVLVHEVGHFLGLGHDDRFDGSNGESLMNTTPQPFTGVPVIRADDIAGVAAVYPSGDPDCASDDDCLSANYCPIGVGDPCAAGTKTFCATDGSCPRAELCMEGECVDVLGERGAPCWSETGAGLGRGMTCDEGLRCEVADGFFRGRCTGPCASDADCAPNGVCRKAEGASEKECVFPGILEAGEPCDEDGQCKSAACIDQACARSCTVDCDCADPSGEFTDGPACRGGACVPGRTSCYGAEGNRTLSATLCATGAQAPGRTGERLSPWMLAAFAIAWAQRRRRPRRASGTHPAPRR